MAVCPQEVSLLRPEEWRATSASTGQVGDYSTSFARAAFLRMLGRDDSGGDAAERRRSPGEGDAADDEGEMTLRGS